MTVPTKPQVRAGNLWNTYIRGWSAGASVRALDPKFTEHSNEEIRVAYVEGYKAGRDARNLMSQAAAFKYGYQPSILRLAGDPPVERCGVEGCRLPPEHGGDHKYGRNIP